MQKHFCLGLVVSLVAASACAQGQSPYPIAYDLQFIPSYEYVNSMTLNTDAREYYAVFILVFQNKGNVKLPINDRYEIITSKGEKHKGGFHPMVKKHIQSKKSFEAVKGEVDWVNSNETKYNIAIFDLISDATPSFKLYIHGLPDLNGQPNKLQIVTEFQHLKETIVRDGTNSKDPTIVWEKDPDPAQKHRYIARWRRLKTVQMEEPQPQK